MVHEQFTAEELNQLRKNYPDLVIVSHHECPPAVIKSSDFTGGGLYYKDLMGDESEESLLSEEE
jgi:quinolinate synthase